MAEITIDEKRLEELVEKSVQKHLRSNLEDMEEVRRSPGGAIVRLEAKLESIEKNMVTKADLADFRTELIERTDKLVTPLYERIARAEGTLGERIAKLETGQKLIYAFLLTIMAMLIKLVFFP